MYMLDESLKVNYECKAPGQNLENALLSTHISEKESIGTSEAVNFIHKEKHVLFNVEHEKPFKPKTRVWSKEEITYLDEIMTLNPYQPVRRFWTGISRKLNTYLQSKGFKSSRNGKQCREKWFNQLSNKDLKHPWTSEEEEKLVVLNLRLGNRWKDIAKELNTKLEHEVKNKYYGLMRKRIREIRKQLISEGYSKHLLPNMKYISDKLGSEVCYLELDETLILERCGLLNNKYNEMDDTEELSFLTSSYEFK
jgi:hypothetical protein